MLLVLAVRMYLRTERASSVKGSGVQNSFLLYNILVSCTN